VEKIELIKTEMKINKGIQRQMYILSRYIHPTQRHKMDERILNGLCQKVLILFFPEMM
jgi:hypothetical protein